MRTDMRTCTCAHMCIDVRMILMFSAKPATPAAKPTAKRTDGMHILTHTRGLAHTHSSMHAHACTRTCTHTPSRTHARALVVTMQITPACADHGHGTVRKRHCCPHRGVSPLCPFFFDRRSFYTETSLLLSFLIFSYVTKNEPEGHILLVACWFKAISQSLPLMCHAELLQASLIADTDNCSAAQS